MLSALRIRIKGSVQGVGFRPFVYRIARRAGLAGFVLNDTLGVLVEVEGHIHKLHEFLRMLASEAPPASRIESTETTVTEPSGRKDFRISDSRVLDERRPVIPPDLATCPDCVQEIFDPEDRRYGYPFTNCTNCGPRFTIVRNIPYDRPLTSMDEFAMCPECLAEYGDPEDRRFHAQPNACAKCGPSLELLDSKREKIKCTDPLAETVRMLHDGKVVAIKGLGGFHLACDAANPEAILTLRERKNRPFKPLALMCPDVDAARLFARVSEKEEELLTHYSSPIVLLEKRERGTLEEVAPGLGEVGIMLPYTPLHHLLTRDNFPALVMTSGNLSDEPTIAANERAYEKLSRVADYYLVHDREILIQNDDSIVKLFGDIPVVMRRARGFVPEPFDLELPGGDAPEVLAVGPEEKATVCFLRGEMAIMSQHLGDLRNLESVESFERTTEHLEEMLDLAPKILAHDLHPDFWSTRYAGKRDAQLKVPVQHHFAHVVACMVENRRTDKVLGVAFDGFGLGDDGAAWGGEFLECTLSGYARKAAIDYFPLPGGDAASKEPWRTACALLHRAYGKEGSKIAREVIKNVDTLKIDNLFKILEKGVGMVNTSSAGRLFDAFAALAGVCSFNTYEGQAPMEFEALLLGVEDSDKAYPFELKDINDMLRIDFTPAVGVVVDDVRAGVEAGCVSMKFHNMLAESILDVVKRLAGSDSPRTVALTGGCFQNRYLALRTRALLAQSGFDVIMHSLLPPGDVCVSLGQAVYARMKYLEDK